MPCLVRGREDVDPTTQQRIDTMLKFDVAVGGGLRRRHVADAPVSSFFVTARVVDDIMVTLVAGASAVVLFTWT